MIVKNIFLIIVLLASSLVSAQTTNNLIYRNESFGVYVDKVVQDKFEAKVLSSSDMTSNYKSPEVDKYSPYVKFKFSINSRDNEMLPNKDHTVFIQPVDGKYATTVEFGKQLVSPAQVDQVLNLPENTQWTIRLDMRNVFDGFREKGFYALANGEKMTRNDFRSVYVAGNAAPLSWDFVNLYTRSDLELKDPDGDEIYEVTLTMNSKSNLKSTSDHWKLTRDISNLPLYKSDYPVSDAIYQLTLEEMLKAVEPDSTFRTGQEWAGVWTRDISYSIMLSMAYMQPQVAKYSLMRKVKNNRIIQDTGTGGAYPASTDRIVWALAAWEIYKVTKDLNWLKSSYQIIKNSVEDDIQNIYDAHTGLVRGESSFLDWREQTYPRWMQPADIFESECLGTNAVHYQANIILSEMAKLLNEPKVVKKHQQIAKKIKTGINEYLWLNDKGYYGQFLYGRNYKTASPRSEALGEALCVLFGITDAKQQQSVISKVPVVDFGVPCIYPQIPGIPPYHNNGIWPFVQAYWALAAAKAGNEQSVMESFATIYRPAALFLTNKENFVADNGDFAGTQINSSNMLWSLSGNLALVHRILFGIGFGKNSLDFHPFVPKELSGKRSLTNFRYRNASLDIHMEGYGNKIKTFELDGKAHKPSLPETLKGKHTIRIVLVNQQSVNQETNLVANYTTLETPLVITTGSELKWQPIEGAVGYVILKNGRTVANISDTSYKFELTPFAEYQVMAVDANKVASFASEPVVVAQAENMQVIEVEKYTAKSALGYKNYQGDGFVEISTTQNKKVSIPVDVSKSGIYAVNFRYSNGNGPVNTENKCAIRTLKVDGKFAGTIVLPQRGTNEWSNWGQTNHVQFQLSKGKHVIELVFEPQNENMNGDVNQAMLDAMQLSVIQ